MARLALFCALALFMATKTSILQASQSSIMEPEITDPETLNAFNTYWDAFESYESKALERGKKIFSESWKKINDEFKKNQVSLSQEKYTMLKKSLIKYQIHLEKYPNSPNRPYVLLNLAQILAILADHDDHINPEEKGGSASRQRAISLLQVLEDEYPTFSWKAQGLYLRAMLLEAENKTDSAHKIWRILAKDQELNRYTIYAHLALGDQAFREGRSGDAMEAYLQALKKLENSDSPDSKRDALRIRYRYIWAAYRAGNLDPVIEQGSNLLQTDHKNAASSDNEKIEADTIQLIGDAIHETNNIPLAKRFLKQKNIEKHAPSIGFITLMRAFSNGQYKDTTDLGEWLINEFPLAIERPRILQVTADAFYKLNESRNRRETLAKIAMLLPAKSLWRIRHKGAEESLKDMEKIAREAAIFLANHHYEQGMSSGSPQDFKISLGYFAMLLSHEPNASEANTWRLREAHCNYFMGNYEEAKKIYHSLKSEYKVSNDILQLASYQAVQTDERIWRDTFIREQEKGEDPQNSPLVHEALKNLEQSIDEYALRFPSQTRASDLLLVAANANRDMEKLEIAHNFWQRVLILGGTPMQRKTAIRGQIFAALKSESTKKVIEIAQKALNSEDWAALGADLRKELHGVLATAIAAEGRRLNDEGNVSEAGVLLVRTAKNYPDIPNRDQIFRDGAYMLAISGDWGRAEDACTDYFKAGLTKNRADMTYLLARSEEYQLRLKDAALHYLELGEKYPKHSRAKTSLERAERLALAEEDYVTAARAVEILGETSNSNEERLKLYGRTVSHLEKANDPARALAIARRRLRSSKSNFERLKSRLMLARLAYESGSEQEGLDELSILNKTVESNRQRLSNIEYAELYGQIHLLLGNEQKRIFDDFAIIERGDDISSNISLKLNYFEKLSLEYDQAAAKGLPLVAAEARYKLASSAHELATEISLAASRFEKDFSFRKKNRYQNALQRLQSMTQKYLSANLLAAQKDPTRLKDNEWIKRSFLSIRSDKSDFYDRHYQEHLPRSTFTSNVVDWSL